jgi:S-sulfo-L-cysteine synthase (O-acetyl-L-serine-dependent)
MTTLTGTPGHVARLDETEKLIGQTPLYPIHPHPAAADQRVSVLAKLEARQLGRSAEARVAFGVVKAAILEEKLEGERRLLDVADAHLAMAYGAVCARLGIPLTLVVSPQLSPRVRHFLTAFGAELMVAEGEPHSFAQSLEEEAPEQYYFADHQRNDESWKAHYLGTAREIYHQTQGQVTHFVADVSQRAILLGTGKKLKEVNREIALVALQAAATDESVAIPFADDNISVDPEAIEKRIDAFAREAGMIISPQAALHLIGAEQLAQSLDRGMVVTVFPDDANLVGES